MWSKYSKHCADVLLNGAPLRLCNPLEYLGIAFDVKHKLKVSMASKRIKFLGRLIIFVAVLVLQPLVWYYVIFWTHFVCLYCCMGSKLSLFQMSTCVPVPYSQHGT